MSVADAAKEMVRIAQTHGLAKDVIDLLEKKAGLLAEQVASLEQENAALLRQNRQLKVENENFKKQPQIAQPASDELDEICSKMLVTLANYNGRDGITNHELIQHLGLQKAKGDYHFDQLVKRKFVHTSSGVMGRGMFYHVTSAGRDYMAKKGLL